MASMRDFIKSVGTVLPEIPKPEKKPTLNERFIWTGIALMLYLVMAATPLYGLTGTAAANNASTFLRVVFASAQGTLMTLGIGPIVTAGLILQLLVGSDIIKLDMSDSSDRAIFGSATKLLTLIVIVGESMAYMFGGALGVLTTSQQPVVFIQLVIASVIVLLLDEMIQKGWGLGSGVSLFILAGVCQTVMWYTFSPIPFQVTTGVTQLFGFVPEAISESFNNNLGSVVIRDFKYPSLLTFSLTIVMILVLVYVEGIRIELPITSIKYRGFQGVYPIKLLYVSNIPVILVSALGANVTFFARLLANYSVASPPWWMKYLAVFPASSANGTNTQIPIGGVVFYLTPPQSFQQTLAEPVHSIVYLLYLVGMAVVFARLWVEIGGLNPKAVAKNLMDADVQVPGFRRSGLSIEQMLNRYIPTLTIIGGILIGLIAGVSDLFGVFGTGIGILLMVDIILQYYQMLLKEQVEEISPALAGLIGAS
ncbi:MAG: preprotein translocase subunit SecY [Nitrososphaerota archaeon]|jgi:preprotein translocase SecY subunit|nr:preprotein translocase subunit SecY [Nitrososphaerota archaeon]MDG6963976.1 preprotein translocase subunit SecY [Nitrososphaerota archaeon]MDG6974550.1 preprotein translocase subunit SecY [Nitrososphaerota archaeon]MDG7009440.1 preprotein translocase subunit SecY [Nitrososphaerota archaeon]MDG7015845.1 preprotein translocase subunit SecY [Nitrososphaerota archaeon]